MWPAGAEIVKGAEPLESWHGQRTPLEQAEIPGNIPYLSRAVPGRPGCRAAMRALQGRSRICFLGSRKVGSGVRGFQLAGQKANSFACDTFACAGMGLVAKLSR